MGQGNQIVANGKGTKGKILVLGGGYSGLWAAANAADVARECDSALAITLVSKDGYLEHRPRLYEKNPDTLRVAVGDLVESLGIDLVIGIAASIDARAKTVNVATADGPRLLGYDRLVLATGSELRQLPIPGMAEFAWNIDSYKGAKAFDDHLKAIAGALAEPSNNTFVIIGAGMTGIELAAEMRDRIEQHAGAAAAQAARIILVERGPDVGPTFGAEPRPLIKQALELAKIELRLGTGVASVRRDSVTLTTGEEIATATTVMTVGMSASTLTGQIPGKRDEFGPALCRRQPAGDRCRARLRDRRRRLCLCGRVQYGDNVVPDLAHHGKIRRPQRRVRPARSTLPALPAARLHDVPRSRPVRCCLYQWVRSQSKNVRARSEEAQALDQYRTYQSAEPRTCRSGFGRNAHRRKRKIGNAAIRFAVFPSRAHQNRLATKTPSTASIARSESIATRLLKSRARRSTWPPPARP